MSLENSVIIPREDYAELQEAAYNQPTMTGGQRVASTAQMLVICAGVAAIVPAATVGWAKTVDWLEERRFKRAHRAKFDPMSSTH